MYDVSEDNTPTTPTTPITLPKNSVICLGNYSYYGIYTDDYKYFAELREREHSIRIDVVKQTCRSQMFSITLPGVGLNGVTRLEQFWYKDAIMEIVICTHGQSRIYAFPNFLYLPTIPPTIPPTLAAY